MAREYDFLPDQDSGDHLDKLLLSQRQRFGLLRWVLFGAMTLVALLVQDVAGFRVQLLGGGIDLVPCMIFMITALQGAEQGSIYALLAAVFYYLSGSSPAAVWRSSPSTRWKTASSSTSLWTQQRAAPVPRAFPSASAAISPR